MTNQNLKLETEYIGGDDLPEIKAPFFVVTKKNDKIIWNNSLDKIGGQPNEGETATVTLYEITAGGIDQINAQDFCLNYTGGEQLIIPGKGGQGGSHIYNCEVIFEGVFKYDVTATGHEPLDPIIIIQPPPPDIIFFVSLALASAVIFLGLGYVIGFRKGSNQNRA